MDNGMKMRAEAYAPQVFELVKKMYEEPELGLSEYKSAAMLADCLEGFGFQVERAFVMPTGFKATFDSGKPGPKLAFLCEYDALPEIGHGCAHNLIAGISVLAGAIFKDCAAELGGTVYVIGTPAEETSGGKVEMAKAGVFDEMDAAMMIHPSSNNGVGGRTSALMPLRFEFFGKNAHACKPQAGRSALDAAVLSFVNINLLRQFMEPGAFLHGIIKDGGTAANVIPAYACLEYYFRGNTMGYVDELCARARQCVEGAALAAGCTWKETVYETPYEDFRINYTLANLLGEKMKELGLNDVEPVKEENNGSSDIGAVSYRCPALHGYIKIAEPCVLAHSVEMAAASVSEEGMKALILGARALGETALSLTRDKELLSAVHAEFVRR